MADPLFDKAKKTKSKNDIEEYENSIRHPKAGKKSSLVTDWKFQKIPEDVDVYQDIILEPDFLTPDNPLLMRILENYGADGKYKKLSPEQKVESADNLFKAILGNEEARDKQLDRTELKYLPGDEPKDTDLDILDIPKVKKVKINPLNDPDRPDDKKKMLITAIMKALKEDDI